ncbi:MAG: serine/threonine-protein kinase [Myxococcota bacterium]
MPQARSGVDGEGDTVLAPKERPDSDLELAIGDLRPGGDDDEDAVRAQVLAGLGVSQRVVRLGRYRLGTAIGKGGAGAVFEAQDERLGRRVAVKLVRARITAAEDASMAQRRLLREARAAARLSHPNVVTVFDVGRYDAEDVEGLGIEVASNGVYLVMELVEGVDLREWLVRTKRSPAATLEVMRAAGRGLAAAHEAGLVHRDFKPANVLVCHDGAVKVADFGLARISDSTASGTSNEEEAQFSILTKAGLVVGTLPYMAPEQQEGEATDASDQYSYCIALFEALVGKRPFRGSAVDSYAAKISGTVPATPRLEPWVRNVITRGLAPAPADRYPSMRALLRDLEPPRERRGGWGWIAGLAVVGALAWALPSDECRAKVQRVEQLAEAFADAGPRAVQEADALRQGWDDYCEVREAEEGRDLSARAGCLSDRFEERKHLVELWQAKRLGEAALTESLAGLPPVVACAEPGAGESLLPPPPAAIAAEVRRVRVRLTGAHAQVDAGHIDRGLADARVANEDAVSLGYAPLMVEARSTVAVAELKRGRYDVAARELKQTYWDANEIGHVREMATSAAMLAHLHGKFRGDFDEAMVWERHAEAAAERAGNTGRARASLTNILAANRHAAGDLEAAAALYERAVLELESDDRDASLAIAVALTNLGECLSRTGEFSAAEDALDRAEEIRVARYGAEDPVIVGTMVHQAKNAARQGELEQAKGLYHRSLAILDASSPQRHPWRPTVLGNLGALYGDNDDFDNAAKMFAEAIEQLEREGTRNVAWAGLHKNLGLAHEKRERWDDARTHYDLALPLFPLRDPRHADTLASMAIVALRLGELDRAGSYASEAEAAAQHSAAPDAVRDKLAGLREQLNAAKAG